MIPDLKSLIELQEIDNKIGRERARCERLRERAVELEAGMEKSRKALALAEAELAGVKKEHRTLERDLEDRENKIKKYKTQMVSVKTNKEYQALQHEIAEEEKEIGKIEEQVIRLLEKIDTCNTRLEEAKKAVKESENKTAEQKEKLETEIAGVESQIEQEHEHRSQLSEKVSPRVLAEYEKLLKRRAGTAIVAVKDCICQGCYINIPPQDYEELKPGDKLYFCSNCQRILFWDGIREVAQ